MSMFKKYQNLPKQVEAVQFTDENKDQVFNELTGQYCADFEDNKPILKVTTVHGEIAVVRLGDWVVKDTELGTYYPVKDKIFLNNYAPLDTNDTLEDLLRMQIDGISPVTNKDIKYSPDFIASVQNLEAEKGGIKGVHVVIHAFDHNSNTLDIFVSNNQVQLMYN